MMVEVVLFLERTFNVMTPFFKNAYAVPYFPANF